MLLCLNPGSSIYYPFHMRAMRSSCSYFTFKSFHLHLFILISPITYLENVKLINECMRMSNLLD